MHEQFRQGGGKNRNGKAKFEIPTHDPQTGDPNPYYEELGIRLRSKYPNTSYSAQYESELSSDKFLVSAHKSSSIPWWLYLLGVVSLLSILGNFYFF